MAHRDQDLAGTGLGHGGLFKTEVLGGGGAVGRLARTICCIIFSLHDTRGCAAGAASHTRMQDVPRKRAAIREERPC